VHGQDDWRSFRAASDGAALRLRHSDAALHRTLCERQPLMPLERLIVEMLEQIRVESMAPELGLPGAAHNLRHRFEVWAVALGQSDLAETVQGLTLLTVALICRSRVVGEAVPEALMDLIESTRFALSEVIGHDVRGLRLTRHDQALYGEHALNIARSVAQHTVAGQVQPPATRINPVQPTRERLSLWIDFEGGEDKDAAVAAPGRSLSPDEVLRGYAVFTTAYDRTVQAADLVRAAERQALRLQLDERIAQQGVALQPLVRQLKALLSPPRWQDLENGQDEGRIDGSRLSQLVANPLQRQLFVRERQRPVPDAAVCFLIDCSGSMKAQRESIALLVDVMSRALDLAGVPCEVLGFTTGAWSGGRALRDWRRAGQPPEPGRLNERCHIIFKPAEKAWRLARRDIAALLKPELYRECLDGEALLWAEQRLLAQSASRRILLVISDGCPSDSATAQTNDPLYLEQHLLAVTDRIERSGRVELTALGVGLDMSGYYRHSDMLDLSDLQGQRVFTQILGALRPRRR
jgi:cobaltochelatase CobT